MLAVEKRPQRASKGPAPVSAKIKLPPMRAFAPGRLLPASLTLRCSESLSRAPPFPGDCYASQTPCLPQLSLVPQLHRTDFLNSANAILTAAPYSLSLFPSPDSRDKR